MARKPKPSVPIPTPEPNSFAARLKALRNVHPLITQAEVASKLEIPLRTLQNWEQGKTEPSQYVQGLILKALAALRSQK